MGVVQRTQTHVLYAAGVFNPSLSYLPTVECSVVRVQHILPEPFAVAKNGRTVWRKLLSWMVDAKRCLIS
uniref:Uncharacterized protein n=1 Tax=Globodera rostochiensis TaxID=31243 RepID=A0A914HIK5_GLORO